MLHITPTIAIPWQELDFQYARSGGPGGQNVNKVSSKVLLRWQPAASQALPPGVKQRLLEMLRARLTKEGELLLVSQQFRDQARNVADVLEKLRGLIRAALHPPKPRKPTKPTRCSRQRRLHEKRQRAERKAGRKTFRDGDTS